MAVSIRMKMLGTKHRPVYRIVAVDSRKTRDGRNLGNLGLYAPLKDPIGLEIKEEEVLSFLNKGAIPSATVKSLLKQKGIIRIQEKASNGSVKLVWTKRDAA